MRDPIGMVMQLLVTTAPFFVLAYASRRWPRVAGGLLLILSAFFLALYFGMQRFSHLLFLVKIATAVLFVGPLLSSGVALLQPGEEESPAAGDRVTPTKSRRSFHAGIRSCGDNRRAPLPFTTPSAPFGSYIQSTGLGLALLGGLTAFWREGLATIAFVASAVVQAFLLAM